MDIINEGERLNNWYSSCDLCGDETEKGDYVYIIHGVMHKGEYHYHRIVCMHPECNKLSLYFDPQGEEEFCATRFMEHIDEAIAVSDPEGKLEFISKKDGVGYVAHLIETGRLTYER